MRFLFIATGIGVYTIKFAVANPLPYDYAGDGTRALGLVLMLAAFFVGVIVSRVIGRILSGTYGPPPWFQDILAWLALLATIGMGIEVIYTGFIEPGLSPENRFTNPDRPL